MTKTNLLEKRQRLAQRKNRLKEMEASINAQERKKRTRKLIELGGLVLKANLEEWNSNALLGALLSIKESESDKKQMGSWTHKGGVAFSSEKSPKTPVIIKFKDKPSDEIRVTLKSLGLKWNALRKEWEGYTEVSNLKELLATQKAIIQELETSKEE